MAIKHAIRKNGKGETRTVALTPLKAIRHFCIECVGYVVSEVAKCTSTSCCLYPFRFGMDPSRQGRRKNYVKIPFQKAVLRQNSGDRLVGSGMVASLMK